MKMYVIVVAQRLKSTFWKLFSQSTTMPSATGYGNKFPKMLILAFEANNAMSPTIALFMDFSPLYRGQSSLPRGWVFQWRMQSYITVSMTLYFPHK